MSSSWLSYIWVDRMEFGGIVNWIGSDWTQAFSWRKAGLTWSVYIKICGPEVRIFHVAITEFNGPVWWSDLWTSRKRGESLRQFLDSWISVCIHRACELSLLKCRYCTSTWRYSKPSAISGRATCGVNLHQSGVSFLDLCLHLCHKFCPWIAPVYRNWRSY